MPKTVELTVSNAVWYKELAQYADAAAGNPNIGAIEDRRVRLWPMSHPNNEPRNYLLWIQARAFFPQH